MPRISEIISEPSYPGYRAHNAHTSTSGVTTLGRTVRKLNTLETIWELPDELWTTMEPIFVRVPGRPYPTRAVLPMRVRECRNLGGATPGWRKVGLYRGGPLSSSSDETECSSAPSASRIGRGRILAGSWVGKSTDGDEDRIRVVMKTTTQMVLSETSTVGIGNKRFSRRRVTCPQPLWA